MRRPGGASSSWREIRGTDSAGRLWKPDRGLRHHVESVLQRPTNPPPPRPLAQASGTTLSGAVFNARGTGATSDAALAQRPPPERIPGQCSPPPPPDQGQQNARRSVARFRVACSCLTPCFFQNLVIQWEESGSRRPRTLGDFQSLSPPTRCHFSFVLLPCPWLGKVLGRRPCRTQGKPCSAGSRG